MTVAIENFIQIQGLNKIMILGDMFELGSESKKHQQIVDSLLKVKSVQCFLSVRCFIQVGSVIHNFNFMNHLIPFSLSRGLDYKQHDDTH
jgi:UDP-N-acetylmuramoyl-tripeptide--D-alanyl-D-alanine ligase